MRALPMAAAQTTPDQRSRPVAPSSILSRVGCVGTLSTPHRTGAGETPALHGNRTGADRLLQAPSVGARSWPALRLAAVLVALGLSVAALCTWSAGLLLLWQVMVPLAPLVLVIAPGLWRNICPMATLNALPSRLGWSRGMRLPLWAQRAAVVISAGLFWAVVPLRKVLLDQSGAALAGFVLLLLALALLAGLLFGGKGGWCSHFCPMAPVERLYGHSPLLVLRDTHCRPCSGCARHCYDLQPTQAQLAEVYSDEHGLRRTRLAFACAMPWLSVAFFTQPALSHPAVGAILLLYGRLSLFVAIGAGVSLVLPLCRGFTYQQVIRVHTFAALNLYCLFALHAAWPRAVVAPVLGIALISGLWWWVAARRERIFIGHRILGQVGREHRSRLAAGVQL